MEVAKVLHMNGGTGDDSYAKHSLLQQKVILMAKPLTDEAIYALYSSLSPETICIADLGCSSGPNTFLPVSQLIKTIYEECKNKGQQSPEFHVFLNDLPGNDFNTIFRFFLPTFHEDLKKQNVGGDGFDPPNCFVTGVVGSFYTRLFPFKSLHFVYSSYGIQWLSQGSTEEEKVDSFNIPLYCPSPAEVMCVIEKEGSFTINLLETSELHLDDSRESMAQCVRAFVEPLLVSHFGDGNGLMDDVFHKCKEIYVNCMTKEDAMVTSVIVSLTKIN
ncbi:S-adenosyl-L-methionine:benzoic acid/salicylic acid carboxyl methyltransferase 1-like [Lycium barbarum]|uniref:S-adenosyl-L-methionine:benzoic acid/salicylic acid carboxyl methyltransferase 1-like n=1 Tax=Lycium barbarum TaxID=112863 RepID=UPI00293E7A2A|nr:S-adenosyl-L-methionine:benzoic acid/salicylic acid carboxyl methyltransferase 1-like [Lycium barbarum]